MSSVPLFRRAWQFAYELVQNANKSRKDTAITEHSCDEDSTFKTNGRHYGGGDDDPLDVGCREQPEQFQQSALFPFVICSNSSGAKFTEKQLVADVETAICRYGRNHLQVAQTWNLLGDTNLDKKKLDQAEICYRNAVLSCDGWHLSDSYRQLGVIEYLRGNTDAAVRFLRLAKRTAKHYKSDDHRPDLSSEIGVGATHFYLGRAYIQKERPEKALKCLQTAQKLFERTGAIDHWIETNNAIGAACLQDGFIDTAVETLQRSLRVLESSPKSALTPMLKFRTLSHIGSVYHQKKRYCESQLSFDEAISAIHEESGSDVEISLAMTLVSYADLLRDMRTTNMSPEPFLRKAQQLYQSAGCDALHPQWIELRRKLDDLA